MNVATCSGTFVDDGAITAACQVTRRGECGPERVVAISQRRSQTRRYKGMGRCRDGMCFMMWRT